MKKLLFLTLLLFAALNLVAQSGWIAYYGGYSTDGRIVDYISILNDPSQDIAWSSDSDYDANGNPLPIAEIAKSTDGGATWTSYEPVSLPGSIQPGISMIHQIDANTVYIAAYRRSSIGQQGVWKSTDGGVTWVKSTPNNTFNASPSFCNIVYFFDADHGFTQGDPVNGEFEIYNTSDGGTTWTPIDGANIDNPLAGEYGYVHGFVHAGNSSWFTTSEGRLFRSNDNGATWTAHDTPAIDFGGASHSGHAASVTFADDNNGWLLIRETGDLYKTTDGGDNWTLMSPNGLGNLAGDIAFIPGTTNTLIATDFRQNQSGSAISTDGGLNWTSITQYYFGNSWSNFTNLPAHVTIAARDINFVLSGGINHQHDPTDPQDAPSQGVYKFVQDIAGIADQKIEGLMVYPNPATNMVNIVTKNSDIANISIFDMMGKQLVNLNGSATSNFAVETSNLPKGVYLLKVTDTNNAQQTVKLVIK